MYAISIALMICLSCHLLLETSSTELPSHLAITRSNLFYSAIHHRLRPSAPHHSTLHLITFFKAALMTFVEQILGYHSGGHLYSSPMEYDNRIFWCLTATTTTTVTATTNYYYYYLLLLLLLPPPQALPITTTTTYYYYCYYRHHHHYLLPLLPPPPPITTTTTTTYYYCYYSYHHHYLLLLLLVLLLLLLLNAAKSFFRS